MTFVYILLTILLLDILVIFHEGGHYTAARLSGIKVNEFSVGMGPCVFSHTSGRTGIKYAFRALPIGGFVAMEGEDGDSENSSAFCNRPLILRICTVLAGPFMNVLIGFLCMFILVCVSVTPVSTEIYGFQDGATSCAEGGLMAGDTVLKVGKTSVHSGNELVYEITNKGYEPLTLTVIRDGEKLVLENVVFPTEEEDGVVFGCYDFIMKSAEKSLKNIITHSFWRSCSTVKMIIDSLSDMIKGRYGVESVSGPIGISSVVGEAAKTSFSSLFYLFIVIAINLGIMNLLPFPALDGGRLLLLIIEGIIGRPVPKYIENAINSAGFVLLMVLTFLITAKDILGLFGT